MRLNKHLAGFAAATVCAFGINAFTSTIDAQGPPPGAVRTAAPNVPAEAFTHIEVARSAAGTEWRSVFEWTCNGAISLATPPAPRAGGAGRGGRAGGPPPPPAREAWHAEPQKVFDNLYYLGMTEFSVWAITTPQGIVLLDAIYDY